jgi:hypothetical protein
MVEFEIQESRAIRSWASYTGGATENKEDKNLYKQVTILLKN